MKDNIVKSWGISEDDIESVWKVSSSRIKFSYDNNTDNFSIIHGEKDDVKIQDSGAKIYLTIYVILLYLFLFYFFFHLNIKIKN